MELFNNLIFGFGVALSWQNLLYCMIGVSVGTLIGVLPGIGPLATIAMLLPITFNVAPVGALIMLAGIYYGAQYGGSTTAILVNLPGETSAVVTCIDGYQMARQGRAGPALAIAAIGSFIAGTFGTLLIAVAGPPLAELALKFGAPEYFSLMLMGLVAAAVLAQGDMLKSLAMVAMGLLLGIVGTVAIARGCTPTGVQQLDEVEDCVPLLMSADEVRRAARAGELVGIDTVYVGLDHAGLL